ncbi:MAG: hypothetical protein WCK96_01400 [Methylococcales bacterium]
MITLPEHLEQPFLHIAELEHKPVNKLIEQALTEFLAEWAGYGYRLTRPTNPFFQIHILKPRKNTVNK